MRLIDADALMETIRVREYPLKSIFSSSTNRGMFTIGIQQAVDEQPTIAASPWHRVEKELPDKYTQCLVVDANGKCAVGYYRYDCEAWDSPAFGWIESEDRIYIDDMPMGIGKVVAWMPIEPPKEDA